MPLFSTNSVVDCSLLTLFFSARALSIVHDAWSGATRTSYLGFGVSFADEDYNVWFIVMGHDALREKTGEALAKVILDGITRWESLVKSVR